MSATIALTLQTNGQRIQSQATFDGQAWQSADDFTAEFLNALTEGREPQQYYADPVAGWALEIVELLPEVMSPAIISTDEPDETEPADTIY